MNLADYQIRIKKTTLKNLAITVYSKGMTNQKITKILQEIKAGVKVPRGTVQMVIGHLWNIHEKHKNNSDYVKVGEIKAIIDKLNKIK